MAQCFKQDETSPLELGKNRKEPKRRTPGTSQVQEVRCSGDTRKEASRQWKADETLSFRDEVVLGSAKFY